MAEKKKPKPKREGPTKLTFEITLTEEMLGMTAENPDIAARYISSKAPTKEMSAEEVAAISGDDEEAEEVVEVPRTVFPRDDQGRPCLWDYQIKGWAKDCCRMMQRWDIATATAKLRAYKKIIDGSMFVFPRMIPLILPEGGVVGECQRPLRASTPQGERVAIAVSETVPAGTTLTFTVELWTLDLDAPLYEWLEYGTRRGLGQWRNAGKGRYSWREVTDGDENQNPS